ncbi:C45 family autoproteolytic acyltransferase/hydolase [Lacipirellula limnantheis]|uniref:Acyl-coenzyme A:6-aminopenicillanic acid acyl-transferase n=1 Tax=Lacipirellula limnantheis TaxID=2528024 RepID=A0A517U567_9BACT|nr:C45 family peptidase [Lacipirellula limnantheis]QDT75788.1 Acyl-coenzyme A:6-aminopenicillanic acid acyl-transferase [Lacipirellula limnantheis]
MSYVVKSSIIVFVVISATVQAAVAKPVGESAFAAKRIDGAELRMMGNVPVAILTGSPEEIGRQHAELLAKPGKAMVEFPKRFAEQFGVEAFWPFVTQAGNTLVSRAPQAHRQELAAIAAHSDITTDQLAVGNTLLELRRLGCSAIVVEPSRSETGAPIFGRNFDFPTLGDLDKYSMVIVYRPEGKHAFASVGFPGMIGVISGMNDAGLAAGTLDVEQSADGSRKFNPAGEPLAFVFRRIMEECTTVDEAEKLLRSVKPTTWMNLTVCDRDAGATFEITPDHIERRDAEEGIVRCTNHFRCARTSVGEECWRYDALDIREEAGRVDVRDVQTALDSANQGEMTLQTMVFEPRDLVLHLAIGKPPVSLNRMERIELAPLLKR